MISLLRERIPDSRERLRLGIVHVMCAATARRIESGLKGEFDPDEVWIRPAAAVLAAHTGPGAWAVVYQYE